MGSGSWGIINGTGGTVTTPSNRTSTFTGVAGNQYTLRWTATNGTCALSDDVIIKFNRTPSLAAAGGDQTDMSTCGLTTVTLGANTPSVGTGAWSTVPAGLGSFGNTTFPNSTFTGSAGIPYTLRWTITSPDAVCTASFDDVLVTFNRYPTSANAGTDRTDLTTCGLTSLSLAANSPSFGTGLWSLIGSGSTPSPSNSPTASFSGSQDILYSLKWTISNSPCPSSSDTVNVRFNSIPVTTFSGLNSPYCVTSSPVALTPTVSGGNFSGPGVTGATFNPATAGPGTHNISYSFPLYSASSIAFVAQPVGVTAIPLSDESISGTLPIGFSFNFQGTAYTQFAASSNGYITLGAGTNSNIPQVLPNATAPNNLIAACWADLNPGVGGGGAVNYVTTGNAPNRKLVVSYVNVPFSANGTNPDVSTSIVLYESTDVVEIHTLNVNGSPGNATMGIENSSGTQATTVPGRNASNWGASNEGWRFTPATPCPSITNQSVEVRALPSVANAGADQLGLATCGLTSVSLAGNAPSIGTGAWSIVAGTGGTVVTPSSPTSTFNGVAGNTYTLRWTISNAPCTASFDDVTITFTSNPTVSNAGSDLIGASTCGLTSISLAGNTPSVGTGEWSIINGTGGGIISPTNPTSSFNGVAGSTYTLRWTISNSPCTASTDDVIITFNQNPTPSNAGIDQTGSATCGLTEVTLNANAPAVGIGAWSIISGTGGIITSSGSPSSTFTGSAGSTYTLRWTTSNSPCTVSEDDIQITFNQNPTLADAGADQTGATTCGLTSINLAGNIPSIGSGSWVILNGTGGTVDSPSSPTSSFSGTAGNTYLLRWTISNSPCTATFDDVNVTFNIPPTASNAGTDLTGASTGS